MILCVGGSVHLSVPVAHISAESKLPAIETLWGGRLDLSTFVYVAVDTTGKEPGTFSVVFSHLIFN